MRITTRNPSNIHNHRHDEFSLIKSTILMIVVIILASTTLDVEAFQSFNSERLTQFSHSLSASPIQHPPSSQSTKITSLSSSPNDNDRFSREVRLREEAESPFRKVRYFFYLNIAGGATTSLLISIARIAAALSGVNTDLMDESLRNAAIDLVGLAAVAYFWRQDQAAEESRLIRATKGAELAKLNVRASKAIMTGDDDDAQDTFTTTLASFRRERGIEKRVVIAAAGKEKIQRVLEEARTLQQDLADNDLVVVPVVMPRGVAPELAAPQPTNVAMPVTVGNNWKMLIDEEAADATSQGVKIEEEGFCIVLKKNGRVGQRTRGIFLNNLVGNVVARKEAGMDVKNI
jgi:Low psii accumulation1 / Rep27